MTEPEKRVYIRRSTDRDGNVQLEEVELTTQEAGRLSMTGPARYFPATPEGREAAAASRDTAIARAAAEQTGVLTTGAYSALDGLTAGSVTGQLRQNLGDAQAERTLGIIQEGNPGTALLSRLVGNVAGLPGLGAMGAGRAVAGAVGGGRVLAGAAEGLFGGTLAAAEQAALTGDDISEHLMANLGLGLLAGAGGEALLGARLGRTGAAEVAAREAAVSQATAPGFLGRLLDNTHEVIAGTNTRTSPLTGRPIREVLDDARPVHDIGEGQFLDGMAQELDDLWRASGDARTSIDLENFASSRAVRESAEQMAPGQIASRFEGRLGAIGQAVQEAIDAAEDAVPAAARQAVAALGGALPHTGNTQALAHAARIRRLLDTAAGDSRGTLQRALGESVLSLDALVGESVGGDLGQLFRRRAEFAGNLARAEAKVARFVDPDAVTPTISRAKLRSRLEQAIRSQDRGAIDAINEFLTASQAVDDLAAEVGQTAGTPGRFAKSIGTVAERIKAYEAFREMGLWVTRETQASGLAAAFGGSTPGGTAALGAALGFGVGGPMGALGGLALGAAGAYLTRPIRASQTIHRLRGMIGRNRARATRAIQQTQTNLASTKRVPHVRLPVPKAGIALALVNGSRQERREEYDRLVSQLEEFAANPVDMANELATGLGGIDEFAEGAAMHTAMKLQNGINVLLGALPPARRRAMFQMALGSTDLPASQGEVDDFLQVAAVVEDPFFGVDLMNAGRLSPQSADALRQMYPRIHGELVAMVASTIHERRQRGEHVNYQTAVQYSLFAGAPLDETLSPGFLAAMQDQSAQTQAQEQAQFARPVSTRRPTGFTDNALSSTQQLEQR